MLYTKCIFTKPEEYDGIRISVMSRHTLNDGRTPDTRITNQQFHYWLRDLAPPDRLVGEYLKRGMNFEEYEKQYVGFLRRKSPALLRSLGNLSTIYDITLLCEESTADRCHRRILAEELKRMNPLIRIMHK
jgi:uncharacterized protein YeaO (DUF488 family)